MTREELSPGTRVIVTGNVAVDGIVATGERGTVIDRAKTASAI